MQPYRPGFHRTGHQRQHPDQHARTGLALLLVPSTLPSAGAPTHSSPQQMGVIVITIELRAQILRLYLADQWRVGTIIR